MSCVGFFAPRTDSAKVNKHFHCTTMSTHVSFRTGSLQSKLFLLSLSHSSPMYSQNFFGQQQCRFYAVTFFFFLQTKCSTHVNSCLFTIELIMFIQQTNKFSLNDLHFRNIGINSVGCATKKIRLTKRSVTNAIMCSMSTVWQLIQFVSTAKKQKFEAKFLTGTDFCLFSS